METEIQYLKEVLGDVVSPPHSYRQQGKFPFYLLDTYAFQIIFIYERRVLLATLKKENDFNSQQLEKHVRTIEQTVHEPVVIVLPEMNASGRKNLIAKKINFVVPGKQLFIPDLMMDLRENFAKRKGGKKKDKLIPSAQFILIYHILHHGRHDDLSNRSFKELSVLLKYTPMGISKAAENLKYFELCTIEGTKEKNIRFSGEKHELWHDALPYLATPVIKVVFINSLPPEHLLQSNTSALPEYSDMNPSSQQYYAIDKHIYYGLRKSGRLDNENDHEGRYCLEVWKYDPKVLTMNITNYNSVDPLSLYLSLRDSYDERIEMALEQIIEKFT